MDIDPLLVAWLLLMALDLVWLVAVCLELRNEVS